MEGYRYRYVPLAHSQAGVGFVGINLQGQDGSTFVAVLSAEDARRLLDDLPQQIRIADYQTSN
jgi:hypothetical protein